MVAALHAQRGLLHHMTPLRFYFSSHLLTLNSFLPTSYSFAMQHIRKFAQPGGFLNS